MVLVQGKARREKTWCERRVCQRKIQTWV